MLILNLFIEIIIQRKLLEVIYNYSHLSLLYCQLDSKLYYSTVKYLTSVTFICPIGQGALLSFFLSEVKSECAFDGNSDQIIIVNYICAMKE